MIRKLQDKVLSAYDVATYIYEKAKDIDVFKTMHNQFFHMFELDNSKEDRQQT